MFLVFEQPAGCPERGPRRRPRASRCSEEPRPPGQLSRIRQVVVTDSSFDGVKHHMRFDLSLLFPPSFSCLLMAEKLSSRWEEGDGGGRAV